MFGVTPSTKQKVMWVRNQSLGPQDHRMSSWPHSYLTLKSPPQSVACTMLGSGIQSLQWRGGHSSWALLPVSIDPGIHRVPGVLSSVYQWQSSSSPPSAPALQRCGDCLA